MIRPALTTAVALAVGFVAGDLAARSSMGEIPSAPSAPTVAHTVEQPGREIVLSPSDVESLKRELTAAVMALRDTPAPPEAGPERARMPDRAESPAADQRLRETVDVAIAAGRWTVEDADAMRQLMSDASPAAARDARLAFSRAINQGRLEVDRNPAAFLF